MGVCGFVQLKSKGRQLENFTALMLSCQVGPLASKVGYCLGTWRREKDICLPTPFLFPSLSVADCQQDVGSSFCCLACADPRFLPLRCLVVSRKEGRGQGDSLIVSVHHKCWGKCVYAHACMFGGRLHSSASTPCSEFSQAYFSVLPTGHRVVIPFLPPMVIPFLPLTPGFSGHLFGGLMRPS